MNDIIGHLMCRNLGKTYDIFVCVWGGGGGGIQFYGSYTNTFLNFWRSGLSLGIFASIEVFREIFSFQISFHF